MSFPGRPPMGMPTGMPGMPPRMMAQGYAFAPMGNTANYLEISFSLSLNLSCGRVIRASALDMVGQELKYRPCCVILEA